MCGIYGSTKQYDQKELESKMESIRFRGPDASIAKSINDDVIFAHNRLSILDLDPRSHQPFVYGPVTIVFNGEMYNYLSIKEDLLNKGHTFGTTSDTEVICAAYLEYGKSCVSHLNGMFSFVICDSRENILFGARDRLGQKPFYYLHKGNHFEFASQIKQLKIGNNLTVNDDAVAQYLCWNYVPDPDTIFHEVKKLPAGHQFTYGIGSGKLEVEQYWEVPMHNAEIRDYGDAKKELKRLLNDSVGIRMVSDVPLGVFLSGGIDSSLVAAMAANVSSNKVKTFSIKFSEDTFDESSYARKVSEIIGSQHTEILCDYNEGLNMIEGICEYYDEPFADSSMIPSMLLAKHTREHVTVALSGDGGDESFMGYTRYDWMQKVMPLFKMPSFIRKPLGSILNFSPNYRHKLIGKGIQNSKIENLYIEMMSSMNDSWHKDSSVGRRVAFESFLHRNESLSERISSYDLKTYLNGDINTKVDRATMAYSLESRAPLMDYRIIEFAKKIPTKFKYNNGDKKIILKDVLYEYVDKSLFDRPKSGFGVPLEVWFRNELKELVYDSLTKESLEKIPFVDYHIVQKQIEEHMSGKANRSDLLWKLIVLEKWLSQYS